MADSSQLQRQQFILSVLASNKKGFTINDLIRYVSRAGYEVSNRTISRDLDDISTIFPIYEDEIGKDTYYILDGSLEGIIAINFDEMITLHYLLNLARSHASKDLEASAEALISKLMSNLTSDKKTLMKSLKDAVRVESDMTRFDNELDVQMLSDIRESIADQRTIEITYNALMNREVTVRQVDPYFLELSDGRYVIVGYCHLRKETRAFNVSRISKLKITKNAFSKPENFYDNYVKKRFDKLSSDKQEHLKFKIWGDAAKLVKEFESKRANALVEQEDGSLIFERDAALTDDVMMWVLSYGDEIQVLEPKSLRKLVEKKARGIIANYSNEK